MQTVAIRGATTADANTADDIKNVTAEMVQKIVKFNDLKKEDIIMVFATMTPDLTAYNASAAIRLGLDWDQIPFFTSQEPVIDGMLPRCVRVLIQCNLDKDVTEVQHVYLRDAARLRPDWVKAHD